jgi:hypothetical protein
LQRDEKEEELIIKAPKAKPMPKIHLRCKKQQIDDSIREIRCALLKEIILADLDREPIKPRLAWAIIEYARMRNELPYDDQQMINSVIYDKIHVYGRYFDIGQLCILRSAYIRRCAKNGELLPNGRSPMEGSQRKLLDKQVVG